MDPVYRSELEHYTRSEKVFFWIKRILFYIYVPITGILLLVFLWQSIMLNNKLLSNLEQNTI